MENLFYVFAFLITENKLVSANCFCYFKCNMKANVFPNVTNFSWAEIKGTINAANLSIKY